MRVHDDTLQGLTEVLEYVRGDKTKARSVIVEPARDVSETAIDQLLLYKISTLPQAKIQKLNVYVDELMQA